MKKRKVYVKDKRMNEKKVKVKGKRINECINERK